MILRARCAVGTLLLVTGRPAVMAGVAATEFAAAPASADSPTPSPILSPCWMPCWTVRGRFSDCWS
jgi:hypothetical protein